MPEVGLEPTRSQAPGDFESPASTSFTTPAPANDFVQRGYVRCLTRLVSRLFTVFAVPFALDFKNRFAKVVSRGVVAQLGEHLSGRQEVTGSIPVNSTNS